MTTFTNGVRATLMAALCLGPVSVLAEGDPAKGKKVFRKCKSCHALEAGKNRVGPSLHGIIDAPAGAVEGFGYSAALKDADFVWDTEALTAFLTKPKDALPGTSMSFSGLRKPAEIADVLAYIAEQSGS